MARWLSNTFSLHTISLLWIVIAVYMNVFADGGHIYTHSSIYFRGCPLPVLGIQDGKVVRIPEFDGIHRIHPIYSVIINVVLWALPLLIFRRLYFRIQWGRRLRAGLCVKCGYNLRGNTAACPECGRLPQSLLNPRQKLTGR